jgi:hypothetical protein
MVDGVRIPIEVGQVWELAPGERAEITAIRATDGMPVKAKMTVEVPRVLSADGRLIGRCDRRLSRLISPAAIQQNERSRLRGLLWIAWHEMNAIRARSGVPLNFDGMPQGISEEYWSNIVDAMQMELGEDARPWPSDDAKAVFERMRR